ncbi:MAG: two-CW domain-containing protein [Thermodesulfobacteriota bacterium]
MPVYMTLHEETFVSRILLESRWTEIAREDRATWQMTFFNVAMGKRFCLWEANDPGPIRQIFRDLGITWTDMFEVEETSASRWRLWEAKTRKLVPNCWDVLKCGNQPGGPFTRSNGVCPVAEERRFWGRNRGLYAGRSCWNVEGTLCNGNPPMSLAEKAETCPRCVFFQQVRHEEGVRFER